MPPPCCSFPRWTTFRKREPVSLPADPFVPVPPVAYCIFHQSAPHIQPAEYAQTLRELHRRIAEEGTLLAATRTRVLREAIAREAQVVRGALSPFLQTPIQSDAVDVRRMLEESLEKFAGQLHGREGAAVHYTLGGRVFVAPSRKSLERRLLQQGRAYLAGLGFGMTRNDPAVYESQFVVGGGAGLDLLEYLVRDRLGIYATTHGKHLGQFQRTSYAAYNLVHALGALPPEVKLGSCTEADLFFTKPGLRYGEFREHLTAALNGLAAEVAPEHLSLWQRKLGLGSGVEYVLRIVGGNAAQIGESVQWLATAVPAPPVKKALAVEGCLLVKELLFSS